VVLKRPQDRVYKQERTALELKQRHPSKIQTKQNQGYKQTAGTETHSSTPVKRKINKNLPTNQPTKTKQNRTGMIMSEKT
jgi:hypothetical protein